MGSGRDEEVEQTVSGTPLTYSSRSFPIDITILTEISNERTTLINVVKALGEYLTSEEGDLRTKGTHNRDGVTNECLHLMQS